MNGARPPSSKRGQFRTRISAAVRYVVLPILAVIGLIALFKAHEAVSPDTRFLPGVWLNRIRAVDACLFPDENTRNLLNTSRSLLEHFSPTLPLVLAQVVVRPEPLPWILLDPDALQSIVNPAQFGARLSGAKTLVFGSFEESFECIVQAGIRNFTIQFVSDDLVKFVSGDYAIYLTKIYRRQNYWIYSSVVNGTFLALLPFDVKAIDLNGGVVLVPANVQKFLEDVPRARFIPCNETRVAEFRAANPTIFNEQHKISNKQFEELVYFRDLLQSHGVTPFLSSGTLLGWYRECNIIPSTTDLDMCAFPEQYTSRLEQAIVDDPRLSIYWVLGTPESSLELTVNSNGVKMDLFFIYPEGNVSYIAGMLVPKHQKMKWYYPGHINELCSGELLGHLMPVPCNPELILEGNYGPYWMTPHHDSKFDWKSSHKNLKMSEVYSAEDWKRAFRTKFKTSHGKYVGSMLKYR